MEKIRLNLKTGQIDKHQAMNFIIAHCYNGWFHS